MLGTQSRTIHDFLNTLSDWVLENRNSTVFGPPKDIHPVEELQMYDVDYVF